MRLKKAKSSVLFTLTRHVETQDSSLSDNFLYLNYKINKVFLHQPQMSLVIQFFYNLFCRFKISCCQEIYQQTSVKNSKMKTYVQLDFLSLISESLMLRVLHVENLMAIELLQVLELLLMSFFYSRGGFFQAGEMSNFSTAGGDFPYNVQLS